MLCAGNEGEGGSGQGEEGGGARFQNGPTITKPRPLCFRVGLCCDSNKRRSEGAKVSLSKRGRRRRRKGIMTAQLPSSPSSLLSTANGRFGLAPHPLYYHHFYTVLYCQGFWKEGGNDDSTHPKKRGKSVAYKWKRGNGKSLLTEKKRCFSSSLPLSWLSWQMMTRHTCAIFPLPFLSRDQHHHHAPPPPPPLSLSVGRPHPVFPLSSTLSPVTMTEAAAAAAAQPKNPGRRRRSSPLAASEPKGVSWEGGGKRLLVSMFPC